MEELYVQEAVDGHDLRRISSLNGMLELLVESA
jgi:hypothetical protein